MLVAQFNDHIRILICLEGVLLRQFVSIRNGVAIWCRVSQINGLSSRTINWRGLNDLATVLVDNLS